MRRAGPRVPRLTLGLAIGASALTMALAGAPPLVHAADHLDAGLAGTSPSHRGDGDINDVYVFPSPEHPDRTVLIMTTHPALGVVTTDPTYATDIRYDINVVDLTPPPSRPGRATGLTRYSLNFRSAFRGGSQLFTVFSIGDHTGFVGLGRTNEVTETDEARVFAGKVSDPFFFDLAAFNNTVQARLDQRILPLNLHGETGRQVCSATTNAVDRFANFNTNAIVLEVPNSDLGDHVAVWGATTKTRSLRGSGPQIDRMARPAINTVFNGRKVLLNEGDDADKDIFNAIADPTEDATTETTSGGTFHENVALVLSRFDGVAQALAGLPPRPQSTLEGLADALLPDVLPFEVGNASTDGIFNGRSLTDDVIDNELPIVTNGLVTTDCVGPHGDYRPSFPYLGLPH